MIWIAPSEKDTDTAALEKRLWDAADQFRARPRPHLPALRHPRARLKTESNLPSQINHH